MKLTAEQLTTLQNTLRERIIYRETYEEVYDHLLTALKFSDETISVAKAVDTILQNDFGGFRGIRSIEKKWRWMVGRQMIYQQLGYFIDYLKFPLLPITVAVFLLIYYVATNLQFAPNAFIILMTLLIISGLFKGVRYFKTGYNFKDKKKSIKDSPFHILSYVPFYIFWVGNFIRWKLYGDLFFSNWYSFHPVILSLLFTFYIIYIISFYKLYQDEFAKLEIK